MSRRGIEVAEPAQALSIGAVIGGSTPQNARWEAGIIRLTRRVSAARGSLTAPLNVNVVFHVPGDILQPEFVGVRTGSYRKRDSLLMVQVAVPADEPPDVDRALLALVSDALAEAERWARRRRVVHDLEALRALISRA